MRVTRFAWGADGAAEAPVPQRGDRGVAAGRSEWLAVQTRRQRGAQRAFGGDIARMRRLNVPPPSSGLR